MNTLVVLVAVIAVVAAAPQKEAKVAEKAFPFSNGFYQSNQAYYPGQQAYYPGQQFYYPGQQGYNQGYQFRGYYPGQQGYYPGYQGYQGYQGFQGYQGYYPGYQGYNRGYYQSAPAVSVFPNAPSATPAPALVTPTPFVSKASPVVQYTAPAPAPVYKPVDNKLPVILKQSQEDNLDGSFRYGFETENGIVAQAAGYVKNAGSQEPVQVIEGSYSYTAADGTPVDVKYYADETGFHAFGNVIPTTPPEIARSLELNAQQPQKPEDSQKK